MDTFQVQASDTSVLDRSHLVNEMQAQSTEAELFPVLIGTHVAYFHRIDGGYDKQNGYHVVNLIHDVQGNYSPPNKIYSDTIEVHLNDYFNLEVADVWQMGDYPEDDFVLSLKVTGYQQGPYAFSEEMTAEIDNREEEISYDE